MDRIDTIAHLRRSIRTYKLHVYEQSCRLMHDTEGVMKMGFHLMIVLQGVEGNHCNLNPPGTLQSGSLHCGRSRAAACCLLRGHGCMRWKLGLRLERYGMYLKIRKLIQTPHISPLYTHSPRHTTMICASCLHNATQQSFME